MRSDSGRNSLIQKRVSETAGGPLRQTNGADAQLATSALIEQQQGRRSLSITKPATANIISMLALIVVWEIVAIIVNNPLTLPTPISVARALGNLTTNGGLWGPALVSARVFILGFVFALALGLPVGVLIASWRLAERTVHSWLIISWATPIIALLPLLVTWFGLTTVTQLIVVALSAFFPVVVNTQVGIEAVEKLLVDAARVFGASPAKVLFRVKLPGAMPMIAAGIQVAVGRAVLGVVVAELFVSSTGLGGKMSYYANYFQIADYFATLVVFVAFSVVVTEAADYLARRMTRFRG